MGMDPDLGVAVAAAVAVAVAEKYIGVVVLLLGDLGSAFDEFHRLHKVSEIEASGNQPGLIIQLPTGNLPNHLLGLG